LYTKSWTKLVLSVKQFDIPKKLYPRIPTSIIVIPKKSKYGQEYCKVNNFVLSLFESPFTKKRHKLAREFCNHFPNMLDPLLISLNIH